MKEPTIYAINNFLSDEECDHYINISKDKFKQALVSGNNGGILSSNRTGKNCWINHDNDEITLKVAKRISEIVNYPLENAESFQIIHYDKSQHYYNHYDGWLFNNSEKSNRCLLHGGQRMVTALVYLNNVEKGGETRFTRLKLNIMPDKGKLLVFNNCNKDTNTVNEQSEHSGMPVIEGEKYAFNLWFRQQSRDKLYKYKYVNTNEEQINSHDINILDTKMIISNNPLIYTIDNLLTEKDCNILIDKIKYLKNTSNNKSREIYWLKNNDISDLINKISKIINISSDYFENLQITQYYIGSAHNNYYDSYTNDDIGQKYMKNKGQRIWSVMGFLNNNKAKLKFNKINKEIDLDKGKIVVIKNTIQNTENRDINTIKTITHIQDKELYVFNLWIRNKNKDNIILDNTYKKDLIEFYKNIDNNDIKTLNTFTFINYMNKNETIKLINNIKSKKIVNKDCFNKIYDFSEYKPTIVSNIINEDILNILQKYINDNIDNNKFKFGDRQSDRYKIRNDIITRILHYELLELIEYVIGKKLKPTYTYLSAYIEGAELPAHTDNPDCEYTVSFVIYKEPQELYYPIYVDKTKQDIKYKGRYEYTPEKDKCIEIDCDIGTVILFSGTDHIHFREKLEGKKYYTLLLHYCEK